ncbi:MAG TPA: hypothetical protein PKW55_07070 [Spirochaetota bacterium]|nr:hypothetical protein [Spirochaetota bacterium]HOM38723.1 hypothetical protein [Spirochaetota bacterium]HPQ49520.1 hypothetical protein [Spirochaetota bacterium]
MYFYILQIYDINYKEDIILALTTVGILNATLILGENLESIIKTDIELFKGLLKQKDQKKRIAGVVIGYTESKEKLKGIKLLIQQAGVKNPDNVFSIIVLEAEKI